MAFAILADDSVTLVISSPQSSEESNPRIFIQSEMDLGNTSCSSIASLEMLYEVALSVAFGGWVKSVSGWGIK